MPFPEYGLMIGRNGESPYADSLIGMDRGAAGNTAFSGARDQFSRDYVNKIVAGELEKKRRMDEQAALRGKMGDALAGRFQQPQANPAPQAASTQAAQPSATAAGPVAPSMRDEAAYRMLRQSLRVGEDPNRRVTIQGGPGRDLTDVERQAALSLLSPDAMYRPMERGAPIRYRMGGGDLYNRDQDGVQDPSLGTAAGVKEMQTGYKPVGTIGWADVQKELARRQEQELAQRKIDEEAAAQERARTAKAADFEQGLSQDVRKAKELQAIKAEDPVVKAQLAAAGQQGKLTELSIKDKESDIQEKQGRRKAGEEYRAFMERAMADGKFDDDEAFTGEGLKAQAEGRLPPSRQEFDSARLEKQAKLDEQRRELTSIAVQRALAAKDYQKARELSKSGNIDLPPDLANAQELVGSPIFQDKLRMFANKANSRHFPDANFKAQIMQEAQQLVQYLTNNGLSQDSAEAALRSALAPLIKSATSEKLRSGLDTLMQINPFLWGGAAASEAVGKPLSIRQQLGLE